MTVHVASTAQDVLIAAAEAFANACVGANVDPTALLLWVADAHTNACLDAAEAGAEIRRLHADGAITYRLVIDQAPGLITLCGVRPDGQEFVLYELERKSLVPAAIRRAFADEDS